MKEGVCYYTSQWCAIQPYLFDVIEDELGMSGDKEKEFVRTCSSILAQVDFSKYAWCGNGRRPANRESIFKMFILKARYNYPDTKATLQIIKQSPRFRRLCGWESLAEVPSEATVSRAFEEFAKDDMITKAQQHLVETALGENGIFHVSHDSTAIEAREKGTRKKQSEEESAATSLSAQRTRTADENIALLPKHCDWGCKIDSKGNKKAWKGYKLHLSCADGDIPLCGFISSANMHDSKAMIPMMQKASESFTYFYDLADAGYDAEEIRQESLALSHVPIIDRNPRRGEKNVIDVGGRNVGIIDATTKRYYQRSSIERVFSHLFEAHGGKNIRVRGHSKVYLHLMFGILVITVEQIFKAVMPA